MWRPTWATSACAACRSSTATSSWSASSRLAISPWSKAGAPPATPSKTSRARAGRIRRPRLPSDMNDSLDQVGAPDPELKTSPIIDESEYDEQAASRDLELEEGVCYFNGAAYPIGAYVQSGSDLL